MNNNVTTPLVSTVIVVAIISMLLCSLTFFSINITVTLLLLAGAWALDALLKNMLQFENTTIFADLSFASFVFSLGRGLNLLNADLLLRSNLNHIILVFLTTFMLLLLWLGNLSMCIYLTQKESENSEQKGAAYWLYWGVSFIFSISSALFVLAQEAQLNALNVGLDLIAR